MGQVQIQTTKIYNLITESISKGYATISMQGSSRSGKTYNIMIWLILKAVSCKNTSISIVRKTLPSIKMTVFRDFIKIVQDLGLYNQAQLNKTELIYKFSNGSYVEFFSVDNEQKVRGAKRNILFVNEANELTEIQWTQLMLRTTELKIIDYNPSFSEDHWIYSKVNKDPRTAYHITTYKDNPFLEQSVIDNIESLKYTNPNLWQVYGLGQRAEIEGLIFKNIDIIKDLPKLKYKVYRGVDFGYTNDPTAIVKVYFCDNNVYIEELAYRTQMLTSDIIKELKKGEEKVISESADPRLVDEIYRAGINIHPVNKFKGSVEAGIAKMQEYKIHILESSTNIIKEFKNYTYCQDKEGKWLNQPIDAFNHAIDAVRYVFLEEIIGKNRRPINYKGLSQIVY